MDTLDIKWEHTCAADLVTSKLVEYFQNEENYKIPFMISITGIPGSGKSISSGILKENLNELIASCGKLKDLNIQILTLQMDGFHLYRSELDEIEKFNSEVLEGDQVKAHYYRGAYWTFNSGSFLDRLKQLKDPEISIVKFPSFDHAVKDPEEDTFIVSKKIDENSIPTIIITEGLYLLLKDEPNETTYSGKIPDKESHLSNWSQISDLFDYKIFIDCDLDTSMERVVKRNSEAIGFDIEYCQKRVQEVDRDNALLVIQNKVHADLLVTFQHDSDRLS
ncbi:unnamed protein product [Moneuplotes crassus]|uniref:Phosphoribulokinase/uridine kinase domain-containing protein n=1 Tax=Euplotes crassus TaxID=5936 RepID=A0AAD1XUG8_EUPCR|nr:unnamed protein product [Moneuplotes crassus]